MSARSEQRGFRDVEASDDASDAVFPKAAVATAAGGILLSLLVGSGAALVASTVGMPAWTILIAVYAGVFGVLFHTVRRAARRFGTGRLRTDLGWYVLPGDLGRGLVVALVALIAAGLAAGPFRRTGFRSNAAWLGDTPGSVVLVFAVVALVGAPLIEELMFRGLLLRSLTSWIGPRAAIAVQGMVFAVGHLDPTAGLHNLAGFVQFGVWGGVLGVAARRYRRLGPTMVAHFLSNLMAVTVLLLAR